MSACASCMSARLWMAAGLTRDRDPYSALGGGGGGEERVGGGGVAVGAGPLSRAALVGGCSELLALTAKAPALGGQGRHFVCKALAARPAVPRLTQSRRPPRAWPT